MSVIGQVFAIIGGIATVIIIGIIGCALKVSSDADDQTGADDNYE